MKDEWMGSEDMRGNLNDNQKKEKLAAIKTCYHKLESCLHENARDKREGWVNCQRAPMNNYATMNTYRRVSTWFDAIGEIHEIISKGTYLNLEKSWSINSSNLKNQAIEKKRVLKHCNQPTKGTNTTERKKSKIRRIIILALANKFRK